MVYLNDLGAGSQSKWRTISPSKLDPPLELHLVCLLQAPPIAIYLDEINRYTLFTRCRKPRLRTAQAQIHGSPSHAAYCNRKGSNIVKRLG
jgi:hypothetical protein